MAFMENNVWKIEKAGLYFFGHINRYYLEVEISRKGYHWAFSMNVEKVQSLLDVLDIDYEDGAYVYEALSGKFITAIPETDNMFVAGNRVAKVGDPYGMELIDLREES